MWEHMFIQCEYVWIVFGLDYFPKFSLSLHQGKMLLGIDQNRTVDNDKELAFLLEIPGGKTKIN